MKPCFTNMGARDRHHWTMLAISACVLVLAFVLQVRSDQRVAFWGLQDLPMPTTCIAHDLFGIDCPGCGLTRSFIYLAHGDWRASLDIHRLGWLMALAILFQFPYRIYRLRCNEKSPEDAWIPKSFGYMLIVLLFANWLFNVLSS